MPSAASPGKNPSLPCPLPADKHTQTRLSFTWVCCGLVREMAGILGGSRSHGELLGVGKGRAGWGRTGTDRHGEPRGASSLRVAEMGSELCGAAAELCAVVGVVWDCSLSLLIWSEQARKGHFPGVPPPSHNPFVLAPSPGPPAAEIRGRNWDFSREGSLTEGFPWHSSVPCSVSAPLSRGEGVCPGSRLLGARAAGQNLAHPVPARAGTAEAARRQKGDQNPLNLQQTTNSRQVGKFRTRLASLFFFFFPLLICPCFG